MSGTGKKSRITGCCLVAIEDFKSSRVVSASFGWGMKPESLSRAFARLRDSGVKVSRNNVAMSDIEGLHDYVEEEKSTGWKQVGS